MADFVVYHNSDAMGYSARDVDSLSVVTDKVVSQAACGGRVGLLTGEGKPRTYYVCGYFVIDAVESGTDEGFTARVRGTAGSMCHDWPVLNDEGWFPEFRRHLGNFAFGFQPVRDPRFVRGLEQVTGARAR